MCNVYSVHFTSRDEFLLYNNTSLSVYYTLPIAICNVYTLHFTSRNEFLLYSYPSSGCTLYSFYSYV